MTHWIVGDAVPGGELRVWLDDLLEDRAAPDGWIHVTTAPAAIALLQTGRVVELSLDHDLGDDEVAGKGVHVVDYIARAAGRSPDETCGRETGSRSTAPTPPAGIRWRRTIERYASELHRSVGRSRGTVSRISPFTDREPASSAAAKAMALERCPAAG